MKRRAAVLVAVLLVVLAAVLIAYRVVRLGYPLVPTASIKVWQLSIETILGKNEKNLSLRMGLPVSRGPITVAEERIASGSLTFNLLREGVDHIGIWAGNTPSTGTLVNYRASILVKPVRTFGIRRMDPGAYPVSFQEADQALVSRLAARWQRLPADERIKAAGDALSGAWGQFPLSEQDRISWEELVPRVGRTNALMGLLNAAGVAARVQNGLILMEGVTRTPIRWLLAWDGTRWLHMQPDSGAIYDRSLVFLPLTNDDIPPLAATGAIAPEVRYNLSPQVVSQWIAYFDRLRTPDRILNRWSLFSLPPEFQATFRILLLVPIGALMVCILRNIIGFPTFGIFMPVLMALAFRSTGLGYGLVIFGGVILVGYIMRLLLDKLHLLLVPRLSVVLTLVIGMFAFLAVVGYKLDIRELMSVGLLPFVILTMMIERFFVIVEESGVREGIRNAVGSAAVAAITHLILHIETLQLTFFVYPELLLVLAALQILIGRYTGYRLSEVLRFRALHRNQ